MKETTKRGAQLTLMAGKVACEPDLPEHIGATKPTNNAGELTAIIKMCKAVEEVFQPGDTAEIQTDSIVALLAAIGAVPRNKRKKKKGGNTDPNRILKIKARETYKNLQRKTRHAVQIKKIKAHAGNAWNEVADALAAVGRQQAHSKEGHAPNTAELNDRVQRAIAAEGPSTTPALAMRGLRWG